MELVTNLRNPALCGVQPREWNTEDRAGLSIDAQSQGPTATVRERSKFVSDLGPGWIHDAIPGEQGSVELQRVEIPESNMSKQIGIGHRFG